MAMLVGAAALFLGSCEDDLKFQDIVPDYTYSIIRNFKANGQKAEIDHTNGVITNTLPAGAELSKVTVEIELPAGATVSPSSGSTINFAAGPVIFTVSNYGIDREYTAIMEAFGNPSIMTFSIGERMGTIDQDAGIISVTVGSSANLSNLKPQFTIPVGTTVTPASGVAQDFRTPVKYSVVSNDGFTGKSYEVKVTQILAPSIKKFVVADVSGTILEGESKISVLVPFGTDLGNIAPEIDLPEGQTVSPASGVAQDFSGGAVNYTVTNTEGLTKTYAVTVKVGVSNIGFIGDGADVSSIQDDDAKAAAEFLQSVYPNDFHYIPFGDVSGSTLEDMDVVMLYYLSPLPNLGFSATPDNPLSMLPPEFQPGTAQSAALTSYVKNGGHLFVAGDPTPIIHVIGRVPADYSVPPSPGNYQYTEFGCSGEGGCVDYGKPADDIWGLGVKEGTTTGEGLNHPIWTGLNFIGNGELPLSNSSTREARLVWWQHFNNTINGYGCCGEDGLILTEKKFHATRLGSLRWIGDGFGVGAIEFKATNGELDDAFDFNIANNFKGHVISLENTIIGYEFDPNGTVNDFQGNIEKLTTNIIDYLRTL